MWHLSSHSNVATLRTAIHLLLTYVLTYLILTHLLALFNSNTVDYTESDDALVASKKAAWVIASVMLVFGLQKLCVQKN